MPFDPSKHLINLNRDKDGNERKPERWYLPVAARVIWFREEHPTWSILTKIIEHEVGQYALCESEIRDETGRIFANAHKLETLKGFTDYIEKAGTSSVGRALALCGYGTQFAGDFEEGDRLADAPVERKPAQHTAPRIPPVDKRKDLAAAIQADWKVRSEIDPAMRFAARKKSSILKAAKDNLIATPDINEASDGSWALTWLDLAEVADLKAYGKHNRQRLNESKEAQKDLAAETETETEFADEG